MNGTYEIENKVVCVARRKNKYDDDGCEPIYCEGRGLRIG